MKQIDHHSFDRAGLVLGFACAADAVTLARLHEKTRLDCDRTVQDYVRAAVAEGYFDRVWANCPAFAGDNASDRVVKAEIGGQLVGFSRFGLIDTPREIAAAYEVAANWAELHQIYVGVERQGQGVGSRLFDAAVDGARGMGAEHMVINVLRDNSSARAFYEHRGAVCRAEIVEHNRRNGVVYKVPCALYVLKIA